MRAVKGEEVVLKRRSPLSVSALTPLHGSLASARDEVVTLDRRDDPEDAHTIEVTDEDGNSIEDIDAFFEGKKSPTRLQFTDRTNHKRITGLFEYTVAIDLTRLFQVPKRSVDPELAASMPEDLREAGWPEDEDYFYLPKDQREKLAKALSQALIEWRVTSNQQRTFSLQSNLATVVSKNAGAVANALYVRPNGERVKPVIEAFDGVDAYVTNQAAVFFPEADFEPTANDKAVARIEEELMARSEKLPG